MNPSQLEEEAAHAKAALAASEIRYRDLVEDSAFGICCATLDGVLYEVNPAFLHMLGFSAAEEARSLNLLRDVFRYPEHFARILASVLERGRITGAETEWRRCDDSFLTVRLTLRKVAAPIYGDALEIIAEDVTELRTIERRLRQAQKFEAIGQLAGGVAHDLNNVMGAVLGWAELGFEQAKAVPTIAEKFTRIREQCERATALTRELLAFARRQVLQARAVDLNEVVNGLGTFLEKVIGQDIEVKVNNAPLDPVLADPAQIEQALMNLCLNARDAMPDGGRLVLETGVAEIEESYCRIYPYAAPGRYAVLAVSDTGIGMDPETRERIFEPFFTTKKLGQGTGMGLATVYGIVKQHNGFIHVYSELGQGSLFRIYLPVVTGDGREDRNTAAVPAETDLPGGTETILLVEDDDSVREMARQTLSNLGYRVLSAADGEQALKLCAAEMPALAILDLVMPKLGGSAAAMKLRELHSSLPIVLTSGYLADPEKLAGVGLPVFYLQKPFGPGLLGRLVREVLDQAPSAGRVSTA